MNRISTSRGPLGCFAALLLGVGLLGYLGYLAGRPDLGIMRDSTSLTQSRADGLYVGDYTSDQPILMLPDGTRVEFADAWAEHAWKPRLAWLFFDRKEVVAGYHLTLPVTTSIPLETAWPFTFALKLAPSDAHLTSGPGMGLTPAKGIGVYLDTLPAQVHFEVHQKRTPQSDWNDTVARATVSFTRSFQP